MRSDAPCIARPSHRFPAWPCGRCTARWPTSSPRASAPSPGAPSRWATSSATRTSRTHCAARSRCEAAPLGGLTLTGALGAVVKSATMDRPAQPDRYEPLPPLLEIPGFLIRKMSRTAKWITGGIVVLLLVALAVTIPSLLAAKHRDIAAEQRAAARANAARIASLKAESRPVEASGPASRGLTGEEALKARHALAATLSAAILADSTRRLKEGRSEQKTQHVDCGGFPERPGVPDPADTGVPSGPYSCLAVTADIAPGAYTVGGSVGYPYRALVHFITGRFTYCKVSGRPGEQAISAKIDVPVPKACGGR